MNYENAKVALSERYKRNLNRIELSREVYETLGSSMPLGWDFHICEIIYGLEITKGSSWNPEEATDSGEFKLVCKLVESLIGKKLDREAKALEGTNKLYRLNARGIYDKADGETWLPLEITLYHPELMPDCKIEWKRKWRKEAVISDECLGINQGQV